MGTPCHVSTATAARDEFVYRKHSPSKDKPPSLREVIGCGSFVAILISGFVFHSTVGDQASGSWPIWSALIGVGCLAATVWRSAPSRYRLSGLGLLFLLAVLAVLFSDGPETRGIAAAVALEVFGIACLVIAWQMGFDWRRIGRCLLWVLLGNGLVALLCGPLVLASIFAFGWGGVTWPLVVVFVLFMLAIGAGGSAGVWGLDAKATGSTSLANWVAAAGGYFVGVAIIYFLATLAEFRATPVQAGPQPAGGVLLVLPCLSVAAATLAGYSLRAGGSLARPRPPGPRGRIQ